MNFSCGSAWAMKLANFERQDVLPRNRPCCKQLEIAPGVFSSSATVLSKNCGKEDQKLRHYETKKAHETIHHNLILLHPCQPLPLPSLPPQSLYHQVNARLCLSVLCTDWLRSIPNMVSLFVGLGILPICIAWPAVNVV